MVVKLETEVKSTRYNFCNSLQTFQIKIDCIPCKIFQTPILASFFKVARNALVDHKR